MDCGGRTLNKDEDLIKPIIAISISESPDMAIRGFSKEHLDDAMGEIARHLLSMDTKLIYGGDLRPGGFTELIFELVTRHTNRSELSNGYIAAINYLPWPVHAGWTNEKLNKLKNFLNELSELVCLSLDGQPMAIEERLKLPAKIVSDEEWNFGLTAMRQYMASICDARIVLGGRIDGFKGIMPGIAEEALASLHIKQPLFVLGCFGGCAFDIANKLKIISDPNDRVWVGLEQFADYNLSSLNNGLNDDENKILAETAHIDEAVILITRGLLRINK